MFESILERVI